IPSPVTALERATQFADPDLSTTRLAGYRAVDAVDPDITCDGRYVHHSIQIVGLDRTLRLYHRHRDLPRNSQLELRRNERRRAGTHHDARDPVQRPRDDAQVAEQLLGFFFRMRPDLLRQ